MTACGSGNMQILLLHCPLLSQIFRNGYIKSVEMSLSMYKSIPLIYRQRLLTILGSKDPFDMQSVCVVEGKPVLGLRANTLVHNTYTNLLLYDNYLQVDE